MAYFIGAISRVFNLNPQEKLKESKRREPNPWEGEGGLDKGRGLGSPSDSSISMTALSTICSGD